MVDFKKKRRSVNGFLVIDKPAGFSSNQALQRCKFLFNASKAGHTGSLDPFATGLLPLCFGEATKFSRFLLEADKKYSSTFILGKISSTNDAYGEISYIKDASKLSFDNVKQALMSFKGEQKQVPPMVSALKHKGERLYKLARRGEVIERKSRDVSIKNIDIHDYRVSKVKSEFEIDVSFVVSKGTYIRSIASDLGDLLGVGGYVSKLRRLSSGPFGESDMINIETISSLSKENKFEFMDKLLKPLDSVLSHLPQVSLDESAGFNLKRGQSIETSSIPYVGQVKLFMESGEFVGIGEITKSGLVSPKRLVV